MNTNCNQNCIIYRAANEKTRSWSSLPAGISRKESITSLPSAVVSLSIVTLPTSPCISRMSWTGIVADFANSMAISTCRTLFWSSRVVMSPRRSRFRRIWATHRAGPDIAPSFCSHRASSPKMLQLPSFWRKVKCPQPAVFRHFTLDHSKLGGSKNCPCTCCCWELGSWKINGFWMRLTVLQPLSSRPIFQQLEPFEGPLQL